MILVFGIEGCRRDRHCDAYVIAREARPKQSTCTLVTAIGVHVDCFITPLRSVPRNDVQKKATLKKMKAAFRIG